MSNPKIALPLLGLLLLSCFCLGGQIAYSMQQEQNKTTGELIDLSKEQAATMGELAEAINTQADANKTAIEELGTVIDVQRGQMSMLLCILGGLALAIIVLGLVILLKSKGNQAAS